MFLVSCCHDTDTCFCINTRRVRPNIKQEPLLASSDIHAYMQPQAQMLADKCKELRDELKTARDELARLNGLLTETAPRAELNAARKVHGNKSQMTDSPIVVLILDISNASQYTRICLDILKNMYMRRKRRRAKKLRILHRRSWQTLKP
jgi:hypothetical protein